MPPAVRRPNILLVLTDDQGLGDAGCFGSREVRTPAIDSLARDGARGTAFYANSPVCSPTRAALLTGRYPDVVGVPGVIRTHSENSWGYLDPRVPLLPVVLAEAGYRTSLVGKWHLGLEAPNLPTRRGFHRFRGFLGDMMDDYWTHRRDGRNYLREDEREVDPPGHATDLFTGWAVEEIERGAREPEPWFVYLAYNAPHVPLHPPAEWLERVRGRAPAFADSRARLVALIEHMDDGLGRVLSALRETGQEENTLVLFVSDNGGQLDVGADCGGLRSGKGDLYEGGIRVPMCARWPGHIPAGTTCGAPALTMDLFATACDAAGVRPPAGIDGVSLLPALTGAAPALPERDLFWMRREGGPPYHGREAHAVRRGPWKLLQNRPFLPLELYNLEEDPLETRDLAADRPQVVADLARALSAHLQRAGRTPWQPPA